MAIRSFKSLIGGKEEEIQFEDEVLFGAIDNVLRNTVKLNVGTGDIDVNIAEFRVGVLLAVITKAPFERSPNGLQKLTYKEVSAISREIFKVYPVKTFLTDSLSITVGEITEEQEATAEAIVKAKSST